MYPYWCSLYRYTSSKGPVIEDRKPDTLEESSCLNTGDEAPDFTLEGVLCGKKVNVTLSDYRGKWVVLLFYPADFTFV